MNEEMRVSVVIGVTALCAIVGIYYCVVRKLGRRDEQLTQRLQSAFPSSSPPPGNRPD